MIKRHADDVTIDYIIRLRKLEQENERLQNENQLLKQRNEMLWHELMNVGSATRGTKLPFEPTPWATFSKDVQELYAKAASCRAEGE